MLAVEVKNITSAKTCRKGGAQNYGCLSLNWSLTCPKQLRAWDRLYKCFPFN